MIDVIIEPSSIKTILKLTASGNNIHQGRILSDIWPQQKVWIMTNVKNNSWESWLMIFFRCTRNIQCMNGIFWCLHERYNLIFTKIYDVIVFLSLKLEFLILVFSHNLTTLKVLSFFCKFFFYNFALESGAGAYPGGKGLGVKTPTYLENFLNLLGFFEKKNPKPPKIFLSIRKFWKPP